VHTSRIAEPYSDRPRSLAYLVDDIPHCQGATAIPHDEHGKPQAEPTHARVLAALNAEGHAESKLYESAPDLEFFAAEPIYVMRAALRAAAETTKSENGSEETR
jgi:hypothetical protein